MYNKVKNDICQWWRWFSGSVVSDPCDPMDCNLPGSSVHGTSQARILEGVAISFSRECSWPRDQTWVSYIVGSPELNTDSLQTEPPEKPLIYANYTSIKILIYDIGWDIYLIHTHTYIYNFLHYICMYISIYLPLIWDQSVLSQSHYRDSHKIIKDVESYSVEFTLVNKSCFHHWLKIRSHEIWA